MLRTQRVMHDYIDAEHEEDEYADMNELNAFDDNEGEEANEAEEANEVVDENEVGDVNEDAVVNDMSSDPVAASNEILPNQEHQNQSIQPPTLHTNSHHPAQHQSTQQYQMWLQQCPMYQQQYQMYQQQLHVSQQQPPHVQNLQPMFAYPPLVPFGLTSPLAPPQLTSPLSPPQEESSQLALLQQEPLSSRDQPTSSTTEVLTQNRKRGRPKKSESLLNSQLVLSQTVPNSNETFSKRKRTQTNFFDSHK